MAKTAQVRARLEPSLKEEAERVLEEIGMTPTEAIRVFYRQVIMRRGLPFDVRVPNELTRATFDATDRGEDLHAFDDAKGMLETLGI